jgi:hypothetical protein
MKKAIVSAVAIVAMTNGAALAEQFQVKSGKWKVTSTALNPMMPGGGNHVMTQCFDQSGITPDSLMKQSGDCNFTEVDVTASEMSWKMDCPGNGGGNTIAEAKFTSTGEAMTGTMTMNMSVNGQQMSFDRTWQGEWVGPCD